MNIDYHFEYDSRYYSVPSTLINARVDVRATATAVEAWRDRVRITSHARSYGPKGTAVTKAEHRPQAHREWGEWPPERLVGWAKTKGPKTAEVVAGLLERGGHPESGRRACLGLMRLSERYGEERLEAACVRALAIQSPTYKTVKSILKNGLDKVKRAEEVETKTVVHENIRGGAYFDREEVEQANPIDEIEARYLDEERLAIMNESHAGTGHETPCDGRWEEAKTGNKTNEIEARYGEEDGLGSAEDAGAAPVCNMGVAVRTRVAVTPPVGCSLPELIERLRAAWERPRGTVRSGRQTAERGGHASRSSPEDKSSCRGPSMCLGPAGGNGDPNAGGEASKQCEWENDEATCEGDVSATPRRGDVE